MDATFVADDPRRKARPLLDDILRRGSDQVALAFAFCTAAGVELLLDHASTLSKSESFVVVSASPPTDYVELARLDRAIRGNLFVHWGSLAPVETPLEYAWERNRLSDLVGFSVDSCGRLVGETWIPSIGMNRGLFEVHLLELARVCDWHELRLSGDDRY